MGTDIMLCFHATVLFPFPSTYLAKEATQRMFHNLLLCLGARSTLIPFKMQAKMPRGSQGWCSIFSEARL